MSSFSKAERAGVGLLIGIAGASGSGKTFSALRVARGLAGGDDSKIAFIDTEAGRALHYAPSPGEAPGAATFAFSHASLSEPFTPEAYVGLIEEADRAGFAVIVIDSFSHVWNGDGGLQDIHEAELDKMAGDEAWKREKLSVSAWKGPKTRHKRMVSRLLQCRAHLVICMRAEDKMRMEQTEDERGRKRTVITPAEKLPPSERWQPICEKRFPYELITSLVLSPDAPGVPIPLKLQAQHRPFVPLDRPLDERVGEALAAWARGAKPAGPTPAITNRTAAATPGAAQEAAGARASPTQPAGLSAASDPLQSTASLTPGAADGGPASSPHPQRAGPPLVFNGAPLDPDQPQALDIFPGAEVDEWRSAGKILRLAIEQASTPALAVTWWELNELPFRGASPALAAWIAEALPPLSADAGGDPADSVAPGAAASAPLSHQGAA